MHVAAAALSLLFVVLEAEATARSIFYLDGLAIREFDLTTRASRTVQVFDSFDSDATLVALAVDPPNHRLFFSFVHQSQHSIYRLEYNSDWSEEPAAQRLPVKILSTVNCTALAYDPEEQMVYSNEVTRRAFVRFDPDGAGLETVVHLPVGYSPGVIHISRRHLFYATHADQYSRIYRASLPGLETRSEISREMHLRGVEGIEVDANWVYALHSSQNEITKFDLNTGRVKTILKDVTQHSRPVHILVDDDDIYISDASTRSISHHGETWDPAVISGLEKAGNMQFSFVKIYPVSLDVLRAGWLRTHSLQVDLQTGGGSMYSNWTLTWSTSDSSESVTIQGDPATYHVTNLTPGTRYTLLATPDGGSSPQFSKFACTVPSTTLAAVEREGDNSVDLRVGVAAGSAEGFIINVDQSWDRKNLRTVTESAETLITLEELAGDSCFDVTVIAFCAEQISESSASVRACTGAGTNDGNSRESTFDLDANFVLYTFLLIFAVLAGVALLLGVFLNFSGILDFSKGRTPRNEPSNTQQFTQVHLNQPKNGEAAHVNSTYTPDETAPSNTSQNISL